MNAFPYLALKPPTTTPLPTTTTVTTTTSTTTAPPQPTTRYSYPQQPYQKPDVGYSYNSANQNIGQQSVQRAGQLSVQTIPTFQSAGSNQAMDQLAVQSGQLPSTGDWIRSRPAEKPWWEGQADKNGPDLNWDAEEDRSRSGWQQNQLTKNQPIKYQVNNQLTKNQPIKYTRPRWQEVTEKPWEGIYRNPVKSFKLFDIKIPLSIPHIVRGTRIENLKNPQPLQVRTTTLPTTSTEATTQMVPSRGQTEEGGVQAHGHVGSEKARE